MSGGSDTVLCQSCGAENHSGDEKCAACGAFLPGVLMEMQEAQAKEKLLDSLPKAAAKKIRHLEAELESNPASVALCIQLSNLYKDNKLKDLAVDYMERAAALDPQNKFLQQKVHLLIEGEKPDTQRIVQLQRKEAATQRSYRVVVAVVAALALAAVLLLVKHFVFPSTFRMAQGDGPKREAVWPHFSADGKRVAYLERKNLSLFDMVDSLAATHHPSDSWIMVKPIKGEAVRVTAGGATVTGNVAFGWRPGHNQISYAAYVAKPKPGPAIFIVDVKEGTPKRIAGGTDFAWSADGKTLAYIRYGWQNSGLYLMDVDTRTERRISALDCSNPSWSPTQNELVFQAREEKRYQQLAMQAYSAGLDEAADSQKALFSYVGDIYRCNADSDVVIPVTTDGVYRTPLFTPDGRNVVALTQSSKDTPFNDLVIMDRDGGDRRVLLSPGDPYEYFGKFAFSPDGDQVAFEGYFENLDAPNAAATSDSPMGTIFGGKNYVSDIFVVNTDGTGLTRLTSKKHKFKQNPVFSPDGKLLAYEVMYLDLHREIWAMKR